MMNGMPFPRMIRALVSALILLVAATPFGAAEKAAETKAGKGADVRGWRIAPDAIPTQGPVANARAGDLALSDGDVVLVVGQLAFGGQWIDVAHVADKGYDYLRHVIPVYDQQEALSYSVKSVELQPGGEQGRPAIVVAGEDRRWPRFTLTTRLELLPTSHAVLLTTTLRNGTSETIGPLLPGDRVGFGTDNVFVPYVGNLWRATANETSGTWLTWLCAWQDNFSLGVTPAAGNLRAVFGKIDARVYYGTPTQLKPGDSFTYRRYFPVGGRELSPTPQLAWRLRGAALGVLEGEVQEAGTGKPVADCRVEIVSSTRLPAPLGGKPLFWTSTDRDGRFRVSVPDGRYFAWTERAVGRRGPGTGLSVDVTSGGTTRYPKPLQVSTEVVLSFDVRDAETSKPLPCKLNLEAYPLMPAVDFGPEWHGPGARNSFLSATGQGFFVVTPGRYRVTVSHGPEYEIDQSDRSFLLPQNRLEVQLKRSIHLAEIGLKDYVSLDLGVRTSASSDCLVSARDRVRAAAAEGVQCLVTGDVGSATDLTAALRDLKLADTVTAITGRRAVWRGKTGRGELLVFPTPPGAAPAGQLRREIDAPSSEQFVQALRRAYPQSLLSVCCPMDPYRGYLRTQGFLVDMSRPLPALPPDAKNVGLFEGFSNLDRSPLETHQMFVRLLREGWRCGLAAGSDSHYLWGQENGYPRLYVARSPKAGGTPFDQLRDGLTSGRVLATNGPFIRLLVNGQPPGSLVRANGRTLDVLFEVYAAPWIDVRSVAVYDGEFPYRSLFLPPSTQIQRYPRKETDSSEFQMTIANDVIVTAVAMGQSPLGPVVAQDDRRNFGGYPVAITGPIFVDFDGDGKCTPPNPFKPATTREPF